jgi:hypothetical protein
MWNSTNLIRVFVRIWITDKFPMNSVFAYIYFGVGHLLVTRTGMGLPGSVTGSNDALMGA